MNWLLLVPGIAVLASIRVLVEGYHHKSRRPAPPLDPLGDEIHHHLLLGRSSER